MQKQFLIAPVLIALNEGLKRLGMPSKLAILVNWAGGIALSIVLEGSLTIEAVVYGFLIGSASGGIYDAKKLPEQIRKLI